MGIPVGLEHSWWDGPGFIPALSSISSVRERALHLHVAEATSYCIWGVNSEWESSTSFKEDFAIWRRGYYSKRLFKKLYIVSITSFQFKQSS